MTLFRVFLVLTYVVTLSLTPKSANSAGNSVKTTAHYTVSSRGFVIGDVTTTQRVSEEGGVVNIHFETRTAVKASFLWMGYTLNTTEKGTLQKGNLASYSRKGRENGELIDVEGHSEISSFRFDVLENGVKRSIIIPRNSYDYTTMECPEARLDFSGNALITLRILDVEKMAVVKRDYHLVKNSAYSTGGKEYPCQVVDFTDQNKAARRWITWDGTAVVMYRQDSRGGKNSYSVQATSVSKEM